MVELSEKELQEAKGLNQQYQLIMAQKQAFSSKLKELENALAEIKTAKGRIYYNAGSVLVEFDKKELEEKLEKQKKEIQESLDTITAREKTIREKVQKLQGKAGKSG
ncbi:MAG: prefoldin subunit [Candidatus Diapherotrites archaeon]|nr:prefoldin subunit [Candidatus Diapherotrites archaeon]